MLFYRRCFRSLDMHFDHWMSIRHPTTLFPFIILFFFSVRPPVSMFIPRCRYLEHAPTVLSSSGCKSSLPFPLNRYFVFDWFTESPHSPYCLNCLLVMNSELSLAWAKTTWSSAKCRIYMWWVRWLNSFIYMPTPLHALLHFFRTLLRYILNRVEDKQQPCLRLLETGKLSYNSPFS